MKSATIEVRLTAAQAKKLGPEIEKLWKSNKAPACIVAQVWIEGKDATLRACLVEQPLANAFFALIQYARDSGHLAIKPRPENQKDISK